MSQDHRSSSRLAWRCATRTATNVLLLAPSALRSAGIASLTVVSEQITPLQEVQSRWGESHLLAAPGRGTSARAPSKERERGKGWSQTALHTTEGEQGALHRRRPVECGIAQTQFAYLLLWFGHRLQTVASRCSADRFKPPRALGFS